MEQGQSDTRTRYIPVPSWGEPERAPHSRDHRDRGRS